MRLLLAVILLGLISGCHLFDKEVKEVRAPAEAPTAMAIAAK